MGPRESEIAVWLHWRRQHHLLEMGIGRCEWKTNVTISVRQQCSRWIVLSHPDERQTCIRFDIMAWQWQSKRTNRNIRFGQWFSRRMQVSDEIEVSFCNWMELKTILISTLFMTFAGRVQWNSQWAKANCIISHWYRAMCCGVLTINKGVPRNGGTSKASHWIALHAIRWSNKSPPVTYRAVYFYIGRYSVMVNRWPLCTLGITRPSIQLRSPCLACNSIRAAWKIRWCVGESRIQIIENICHECWAHRCTFALAPIIRRLLFRPTIMASKFSTHNSIQRPSFRTLRGCQMTKRMCRSSRSDSRWTHATAVWCWTDASGICNSFRRTQKVFCTMWVRRIFRLRFSVDL